MVANFIIGINGSVIIPESRRLEHRLGRAATFGFINTTFYFLFVGLVIICIVLLCFPIEILSLISKFDREVLIRNKSLIQLATLLFLVQIIVSFFNDLLVYYRYFILPSVITSLNGLLTVIIVLLFHSAIGMKSVLIASIIAYLISFAVQIFILLRYEHWHFFVVSRKIERHTFFNALYSISSISVSIMVAFIPLYFLSTYAAGAITQLILAQRISEIPNTLLAIQFVTIIGVQFTEKYIKSDLDDFNRSFIRAANVLYFILIPISVTVFFLSDEIVAVLLEHGAIENHASKIDDVLAILMIGVPFTGINYLTSKALVAAQKIKASFYFNLILSLINIVLSFVGISLAAQTGYAWAISVYGITYFLLSFFLLRWTLPFVHYNIVIKSFFLFLCLSVTLMFLTVQLYAVLAPDDFAVLKIGIAGSLHIFLILTLNHFFGINNDVRDFIINIFKRATGKL